jgi:hypothetical protein
VIAHPHWNDHNFEEIKRLKGIVGLEVYNSSCEWSGRPVSEEAWDMCFRYEHYLGAIAADDTHAKETAENRSECDYYDHLWAGRG